MSPRKSLIPSLEMRRHYNEQLLIRMAREIPNVDESKHVKQVVVRAQWGWDSSDPKRIVVKVHNLNGNTVRFKEKLHGFPSEELVAKIGLLL